MLGLTAQCKEVKKHGINRKEKEPLFRSLYLYG